MGKEKAKQNTKLLKGLRKNKITTYNNTHHMSKMYIKNQVIFNA